MEKEKRIVSPEQAYARMTRICAKKEYAPSEIREKLQRMNLAPEVVDTLITRLKKERYIDESRFAESYIRDKIRFNKWGKRKIEMHLIQKKIPRQVIDSAFELFSDQQLTESLQLILEKKRKSIAGKTEYERNGKLIRYALGRGYAMEDIMSCLKKMGEDAFFDEP